jgi:tyrosine-protein kinase Etk/Wzc
VLNTIIAYDIQNNVNKKNLEIQKTLTFLAQQVPILKSNLEQAEITLNAFKAEKRISSDLGSGGGRSLALEKMVALDKTLEELKLKKEELLQTFTENYPLVITVNVQQKRIEKELQLLENEVKSLPQDEQKALSVERDIKVRDQLYLLMLNKIQELQIVQAGIVSDVRVLTPATIAAQLPSNQLIILGIGALCGFVLSFVTIFVRKMLTKVIENPDEVESRLGIPAYAFVPYSKEQKKLAQLAKRQVMCSKPLVLAQSKPKDLAIESLRSLRTMLQFTLQDVKTNLITILGTSPSVGKSFVSLNLAQLLVDSGKRVLLIDADLRKGKLHHYFGVPNKPGLAEILIGEVSFDQAKRNLSEKLDLLTGGKAQISPADLFMREQFKQTIATVSGLYDLIVVDTPPVLAVADSTIMLQKINSVNVLLVAIGADSLLGVEHVMRRFNNNGIKINGLIFNNVTQMKYGYGNYGYYHNYYYYYDNDKKKKRERRE